MMEIMGIIEYLCLYCGHTMSIREMDDRVLATYMNTLSRSPYLIQSGYCRSCGERGVVATLMDLR